MKELTIQEKAKAYDEAKARMSIAFNSNRCTIGFMNEIFPELKESEDERIRKEMISWLKGFIGEANGVGYTEGEIRERIDWLEKKGEPKFKVGDWIVTSYGKVNQVIAVDEDGDGFTLDDDTYFSGSWKDNYHLWTISDAKDGDVLVNGSNIFIFHFINDTRLMGYCHVNTDDGRFYNDIGKNECFCLIDAIVNPATKEQCDTLMKAMTDAGYTFDFEKKELKKIEQKLADKVEPKFKVGDWIVYNRNDSSREILYVYDIRDGRYYFNDNVHFSWSVKECDEKSHLWTIKDARDGDVLVCESEERTLECLFIFKLIADREVHEYCSYRTIDKHFSLKDSFLGYVDNVYHPATKEQHEQLEKAMVDAGYTFDFEKKELKKIEQNPAWSEEDEGFLDSALWHIQNSITNGKIKSFVECPLSIWLKSLKERVQPQPKQEWSEEDEYTLGETIQHLEELIRIEKVKHCGIDVQYYQRDIDWLKSLKERVQPQPKQDWSEEDERILYSIIADMESLKQCRSSHLESYFKECIDWLKSLKGRYTWKPSEEQIEILNMVLTNESIDDNVARILRELREQLKKLK